MAELKLLPLWSSSKGNATIVTDGKSSILVDCGVSGKSLMLGLERYSIIADSLSGILITHEHSDHIKGVGVASRKFNLPIYANQRTWQKLKSCVGEVAEENIKIIETGSSFYIDEILVTSFRIPHDAIDPVGYTFETASGKVSVATDMGELSQEVLTAISGSQCVLLEANYDPFMLDAGSYPYDLKCRIKGSFGHLCNDDSGCIAKLLAQSGTKEIILGHLSEENNFPQIAYETVRDCVKDYKAVVSVVLKDGSIKTKF